MQRRSSSQPIVLVGCLLAIALGAAPGPARAGLDVDFGARLRTGDDTEIFVEISSRYFERSPDDVQRWRERCGSADDLAVVLFLSRHTGRPPAHIAALRAQGLSWWQVGSHLGMPVDVWFVPVARDPGPPYGKAYGHWRKHRRDRHHEFMLSDGEVRDLVAVRVLKEYFGVEADVALRWRSSGRDVGELAAVEYRTRHGRGHDGQQQAGKAKDGKGRGKGKRKVSRASAGR